MSEVFLSSLHGKNPELSISDVHSVTILGGQGKASQKESVSEVRIEIGYYHILAYEGMVRQMKTELQLGRRHDFLPRYCMLQARHSGLINTMTKTTDGYRVRLEGIGLG